MSKVRESIKAISEMTDISELRATETALAAEWRSVPEYGFASQEARDLRKVTTACRERIKRVSYPHYGIRKVLRTKPNGNQTWRMWIASRESELDHS